MKSIFKYFLACIQIFCLVQILSAQKMDNENRNILWTADWNLYNNMIAVGGNHDSLLIYSGEDYAKIKAFPFDGTITSLHWHQTNNMIAVGMQGGSSIASIFNLDNDENYELDSLCEEGVRAVAWNHSGNLLSVGDYDGNIIIYDASGKIVRRIETQQKSIIGLSWHPFQNIIVAVGEYISIYNVENENLTMVEDREEDVLMLCVEWHPSGDFFATGDYGDHHLNYPPLLQYWTADGKNMQKMYGSTAEYRNISWSKNGQLLATASDGIRVWDIEGNLILKKETDHSLWGISWDQKGNKLVSSDFMGKIIIWDSQLKPLKVINRSNE